MGQKAEEQSCGRSAQLRSAVSWVPLCSIGNKLLAALASISTKVSLLMLVVSVVRDDWIVGFVGVIVLSVGNAAVMLLAHLLRGTDR